MIILGGGAAKHHINNANLMERRGLRRSINTAQEFDGSDSGANRTRRSAGERFDRRRTRLYADATLLFSSSAPRRTEPKA